MKECRSAKVRSVNGRLIEWVGTHKIKDSSSLHFGRCVGAVRGTAGSVRKRGKVIKLEDHRTVETGKTEARKFGTHEGK